MGSMSELFSKCFPIQTISLADAFTRRRNQNRISPENSVRSTGPPRLVRRGSDPNPSGTFREELNGEINIHFVGDSGDDSHVVIECPSLGDQLSPPDPPEPSLQGHKGRRSSVIDQKSSYGNNSYLTTIFIETAKNKTLRVVHYRAIDSDEEEDITDRRRAEGNASSGSDDDEEYWFSKWSQRTRLKKTAEEQHIEMRLKHEADEKQNNAEWKQKFLGPKSISSDTENNKDASFSLPPLPPAATTIASVPRIQVTGPDESVTRDTEVPEDEELENSFTNLAFEFDEGDNNNSEDNNGVNSETGGVCYSEEGVSNGDSPAEGTHHHEPDGNCVGGMTGEKPLLFFIHSISGSSDIWKTQINYFHKLGYEIAALDLLGHGLSGTPPQAKLYHFESMVQDVVVVFDHFLQDDENRQAVVIGHGYGACLATVLTRIRPKNVCILVSISGGGPTPMVANYWCDFPWIPIPCTAFPKKKKKGRFVNAELKHVLPRNVLDNLILGQIWLDGDPAFHRRITVPTLLVYGLRDTVVNLVEVCEMERTIPRAYLELIPTAGHMVMWDEPRQLNRMIRKFIESKWS